MAMRERAQVLVRAGSACHAPSQNLSFLFWKMGIQ